VESILSHGCEIWTADCRISKKLLSKEMGSWRRAAKTSKVLQARNNVIKEKIRITLIILERITNNLLKCYRYILRVGDNRRPTRILTWSVEGRKRRGRPQMKWEREVERVLKQTNLLSEEAVKTQIWRKLPENQ